MTDEQPDVVFGFDTTADGTTVAVMARSGPGEPWRIETAAAPDGVTEQQVRDWVAQYVCIDPDVARPEPADLQPWKDAIAEWVGEYADVRLSEWQKTVFAHAMRDGVVTHPNFMSTPRKWSSMLSSERARILGLIDVDPWRVPDGGLLEYDPVHDEWRVELWRWPASDRTVIIRRHAGRKRPPKPAGWGGAYDRYVSQHRAVWPTESAWRKLSEEHLALQQAAGERDGGQR